MPSELPENGFHENVQFNEYVNWDALNFHTLMWARESPRHLKAALDGMIEMKSQDLDFGRAIHAKILEPEIFEASFYVSERCSAIVQSGNRAGQACGNNSKYTDGESWRCGQHCTDGFEEPDSVISGDKAARIEGVAEAIDEHPVARLIEFGHGFEISGVTELMGETIKFRLDKMVTGLRGAGDLGNAIIDLKKVQRGKANDEKFGRSIEDFSYDAQMAWYCDAAQSIDGIERRAIWLIVEDDIPHAVNVIIASDATMDIGRHKYTQWMRDYQRCRERDSWPTIETDIHVGGHTDYNLRKWGEVLQMHDFV